MCRHVSLIYGYKNEKGDVYEVEYYGAGRYQP